MLRTHPDVSRGSNLVVCLATEADIDDLVQFNSAIFHPSVGVWSRLLLSGQRPGTSVGHSLYVRDPKTSAIISSLCVLFQQWRYADVLLSVGQMELVSTAPAWRRRGLIRAQMSKADDLLREHRCVLACVQGAPGVYQRLGHEYAVPLKGGVRLWLGQIPSAGSSGPCSLRPCEARDIPILRRMYDAEMESLLVSSVRDEALWSYQETQSIESKHAYETYVLEREGIVTGYFRLPRHSKASGVVISELSVNGYDELLVVLNFGRRRALQAGLETVLLQLPLAHLAIKAARYLGAEEVPPFAWQVRILDWPTFLMQISPVLERRLGTSMLIGWTGDLSIHLIDQGTLRISIEKGRIGNVVLVKHSETWDAESPAGLFCQLVLGYRSSQALMTWHSDFQVRPTTRFLIDTLFSQWPSFVYEAY